MSGFRIEGASGTLVESKSDGSMLTALTRETENIGGVRLFSENDSGSLTGTSYLKSPETSLDYRLRAGIDTMLFSDEFNAGAQNTANWYHRTTTMTMAQSGGFLVTNSNLSATISTGCSLHTHRVFSLATGASLCQNWNLGITAAPLAGQLFAFGFGNCTSATAVPGDGVWFKLTSAGLQGVINYGGSTTETAVIKSVQSFNVGQIDKYGITVSTTGAEFWCNDQLLAYLDAPLGVAQPFLSTAINTFVQQYNTAAVSGSPQMQVKIGNVAVYMQDIGSNKPWAAQMAGMGLSAYQGQNGGTMGQTANWANTTVTAAATATNTSAALGTGLGGLYQLNAPASSNTDVIISSFQNPAGGTTQSPSQLYVRGVWFDCTNTGAAVATTATIMTAAVAFGHTALSLATADTGSFTNATTKSPRRVPIGTAAFKVGDVIGQNVRVQADFETPIVVNPGEYLQLIVKPILGTATASEVFLFNVGFNAYFE